MIVTVTGLVGMMMTVVAMIVEMILIIRTKEIRKIMILPLITMSPILMTKGINQRKTK